ncbi:uncharacterized protein LOC143048313 [Mytilus galloprovincialis]|uniref:uncharacterized protein LOC143048313 n=1 Tax=Mytilus galloprovincialis TaxID=29158 RepID=UPI003F7BE37E
MKILYVFLIFFSKSAADNGVLDINVPHLTVKAQNSGNMTLQSGLARDLYLEPGPGGKVVFDGEDILEIIKMAKTLPPVWLPHAHNGFFGTFEGGQRIHVKLEARDPENGPLEYKLVAGDLPTGITLDVTGGYINGVVPDIERFYTFTIRAINNQTKYADSVFKMEVLSHDNCKSSPCQHHGSCIDNSNNTYTCVCPEPYSGHSCEIDCRSNAFGVRYKNKIPDAQMSAYLSQSTKLASNGRYSGSSYWCGTNDNSWLQVDLGEPKTVYKTLYQYINSNFYTNGYTLSVSLDGVHFNYVNDTSGLHTFSGGQSTYTNSLPSPILARFVRYHPKGYKSGYYPCMKVELYGC